MQNAWLVSESEHKVTFLQILGCGIEELDNCRLSLTYKDKFATGLAQMCFLEGLLIRSLCICICTNSNFLCRPRCMKLLPYAHWHCFQEKWQLLDFQSCIESVALISSQPSDGWLGSASYYIFEVGKLLDLFLLYYWQGRFWHVLIAIQAFAYRIFLNRIITHFSVIFKFLCKLFLVIIAQQFWAESDGFPAPTITPCWFLHCGTVIPPVLYQFSCRRVGLLYPEHEYNFETWWKDTRSTVSWHQAT
jgi:hypothetical protein